MGLFSLIFDVFRGACVKLTYLGILTFCIALVVGCSADKKTNQSAHIIPSQKIEKSCFDDAGKKQERHLFSDELELLLRANQCFNEARDKHDAVAMARAALIRFDISDRGLLKSVDSQLTMKTISLLRQARIVAGDDKGAQTTIDQLIEDYDIGPDSELSSSDSILYGQLGQLLGIKKNKQFNTYTLDAGAVQTVNLSVTASTSTIVYIEATELSGISLTIKERGNGKTKEGSNKYLCHDASAHGILICRWRPQKDDVVKVIIENSGVVEESVLMITNQ